MACPFIKRHQAVHIQCRERPPERASRQIFRDAASAGGLVSCLRVADEDETPAGCFRNGCGLERSDDLDRVAELRSAVESGGTARQTVVRFQDLEILVRRYMGTVYEGHGDFVTSSLHVHGNLREPLHNSGASSAGLAID